MTTGKRGSGRIRATWTWNLPSISLRKLLHKLYTKQNIIRGFLFLKWLPTWFGGGQCRGCKSPCKLQTGKNKQRGNKLHAFPGGLSMNSASEMHGERALTLNRMESRSGWVIAFTISVLPDRLAKFANLATFWRKLLVAITCGAFDDVWQHFLSNWV